MTHALRILEFDRVLAQVVPHCETEAGAEMAQGLLPAWDSEAVWADLALTREADTALSQARVPSLRGIADVRASARAASRGAVLDAVTLYRVGLTLSVFRSVVQFFRALEELCPGLWERASMLPEASRTEQRILSSVEADGEVLDSASTELARLRRAKVSVAARLTERIHSYTTGKYRDYLSDAVVTQRDGRYVVPLRAEHKGKIRGVVHDTSASGQTVFIEPEDVLQLGNSLREAEAAERAEISRILQELSERVGADGEAIARGVQRAAEVDLALAKARHGHATEGSLPEPDGKARFRIEVGRHPLLDAAIAVPLTLELGYADDTVLITGPNTGGKTVAIKTVGLFIAMAQAGLMPPCRHFRLGPFTQIWADIGDEQSLEQSLSTFSGHIRNIAAAFQGLQPGALILFDELGAGTDPAEGSALAKAVLTRLQAGGARILASTHYGELKVFATNTARVSNASMEFDLKSLRPTYRLLSGTPGASHALRIAERCGLPADVVELARQDAGLEQQDVARMLERLETLQKQASRAQSEADRLAARVRQVEKEAETRLAEAETARRDARRRAADTLEEALRQIRMESAEIFDQLKKDRSDAGMERARKRLKELQDVGGQFTQDFRGRDPRRAEAEVPLAKGDAVRLRQHGQSGVILEPPRNGQAVVQMGPLRMTVKLSELQRVGGVPKAPGPPPNVNPYATSGAPRATARPNLGLQKMTTISAELQLRNFRVEDASESLDKFLDDALLAGLDRVRIVHGKGEGVLRRVVQERLRKHAGVESFRDGEADEGGQGVTIVDFS